MIGGNDAAPIKMFIGFKNRGRCSDVKLHVKKVRCRAIKQPEEQAQLGTQIAMSALFGWAVSDDHGHWNIREMRLDLAQSLNAQRWVQAVKSDFNQIR